MVVSHDQLRVNKDITGEDQRRQAAIDELNSRAMREERSDEAEQDQEPERTEQVRHPVGEIVLRLACEERERDEHAKRQDKGLHYDARVIEGRHDADGVGLENREGCQEKKVGRVALALPVCYEHEAQGTED